MRKPTLVQFFFLFLVLFLLFGDVVKLKKAVHIAVKKLFGK